jgi:cysteine desulfurase/selenocysteine lyase
MSTSTMDIAQIRADFPILSEKVNDHDLVYFDNAATSQKPKVVIDAISNYYTRINSNIHRGVHYLSQRATDAFEETRIKVQQHLNAAHSHEIIFTKGTTDGINLVASSYGHSFIKEGDEVIITNMEHHSNIVPWQLICAQVGASLKIVPINDAGELDLETYKKLLNENTKLVAVNHISNALGTINDVKEITKAAHAVGAVVLIDGAQSVPHMNVDVQDLDADFYTFSAHKMCGPTGLGVLYGKEDLLNSMPPYQGGGEMIKEVFLDHSTFADLPHKFEAGTPNISEVVAFGTAIDYLNEIGWDFIHDQEKELLDYATAKLSSIEGLKIYGEAEKKASVISFLLEGIHPYDVGMILDKLGIAVRTGHHCTQPIMDRFGIPGTVRASFAFYNTTEEIDRLYEGLLRVKTMFS